MDCPGCQQPIGSGECKRFKNTAEELRKGASEACPRCLFALALAECIQKVKNPALPVQQVTVQPGEGGYVLVSGLNPVGGPQVLLDIFQQNGQSVASWLLWEEPL